MLRLSIVVSGLVVLGALWHFWPRTTPESSGGNSIEKDKIQEAKERLKRVEAESLLLRDEVYRSTKDDVKDGGDLLPSAPQKRRASPEKCSSSGKVWDDIAGRCVPQ